MDKISLYVCLIKTTLAVLSFSTIIQYVFQTLGSIDEILNHVAKKKFKNLFGNPFVL